MSDALVWIFSSPAFKGWRVTSSAYAPTLTMREEAGEQSKCKCKSDESSFLFQWKIVFYCLLQMLSAMRWRGTSTNQHFPLPNYRWFCAHFAGLHLHARTISIVSLKISRWSAVEWKCTIISNALRHVVYIMKFQCNRLPPQWFWFN